MKRPKTEDASGKRQAAIWWLLLAMWGCLALCAFILPGCKAQRQAAQSAREDTQAAAGFQSSQASAQSASELMLRWLEVQGAQASISADSMALPSGAKLYGPSLSASADKADYRSAHAGEAESSGESASSGSLQSSSMSESETLIPEPAEKELTAWEKIKQEYFGALCAILAALLAWTFRKPLIAFARRWLPHS